MRVGPSLAATTSLYALLLVLHTNAAPVIPADCRCCKDRSVHVYESNICGDVGIASPCQQLRSTQIKSDLERVLLEKFSCDSFATLRPRSESDSKFALLQSLTSTLQKVTRGSEGGAEGSKREVALVQHKEMPTLRICSWQQFEEHVESIAHLLLDSPEKVVVGGVFCFFMVGAVVQSLREAEAWSRRRRSSRSIRAADDNTPFSTDEEHETIDKTPTQVEDVSRRALKLDSIPEEDEAA